MPYIPNSDEDRKEMLNELGVSGFDELISNIPQRFLIKEDWETSPGKSEQGTLKKLHGIAAKNEVGFINFLGGGAYDHFIPSVVKHVVSRSEFYTAYTPYQPEVSQGTLQFIYEYQTMICELTGMDVSNASLYDGASSNAEAALLAVNYKRRKKILIPENFSPTYKSVLKTYGRGGRYEVVEVPSPKGVIDVNALKNAVNEDTAALIVQYPNYYGLIEELSPLSDIIHDAGGLMVASVNPIPLALLKPPGECGVDIVTGEGQVLGNEINWGGPYLGLFATKNELIRKMPGRIVGMTEDRDGKQGFVLVLQTREQNIRRDKATSNICTNQGLMALKATVYMTLLGKQGIREVADQCLQKAHYLAEQISGIPGFDLKYDNSYFHEFVVECPKPATQVCENMLKHNIFAGVPVGFDATNDLLIAVTEQRTKEEMDFFVEKLKDI